MGVPILTYERFEADDVIGTLATKATAQGFEVAIVTGDKDFFQLVHDGLAVYNPRDEGTWYDASGVKEKFGVTPAQVVDVLALMGDTIDNIKGVPGIGEKGARELVSAYGDLEALLAHAAEIPNKRYREGLLGHARRCAAEPRAGADPDGRAGGVPARDAPVSRRVEGTLLRVVHAPRLPHPRHGLRADRRDRRQGLRRRIVAGRHRRAGRRVARGGTVCLPGARGCAVRDAGGDRRTLVLGPSPPGALRAAHREPGGRGSLR